MTQIVLCGHGHYGTSTLESIHMLAGNVDSYSAVDFTKEMDMNQLQAEIEKLLHAFKDETILFICDIANGTPFKICCMETMMHANVYVLAGVNLAAILETVFGDKDDVHALISTMENVTKESILIYPKK